MNNAFLSGLQTHRIDLEDVVAIWRKLRLGGNKLESVDKIIESERFLAALRGFINELARETGRSSQERRIWRVSGPETAKQLLSPHGPRKFLNSIGLEGLYLLAAWVQVGGSGHELHLVACEDSLIERLNFILEYVPA